jgi:hypothetical protein
MNTKTLLIAASVALLPVGGAFAADQEGSDATAASVAALKANLKNSAGLTIDEVRLTEAGVACINYRVNNEQGGKSRGHAVVQGDEVLKSSTGYKRFEKAWNEHCLGPRGGTTTSQ